LSRGRWAKTFLRLLIRPRGTIHGIRGQTAVIKGIATVQNRVAYTISCGGKTSMVFVFVFG
jgi:hypothetical protein